jgi:hypothetical protein
MTESPTPDVQVTQDDREAAAALIKARPIVENYDIILLGGADDGAFVQAFVRHRLATASEPTREVPTAPAESERDAVMAEREACAQVAEGFDDGATDNLASVAARIIAAAIRNRKSGE